MNFFETRSGELNRRELIKSTLGLAAACLGWTLVPHDSRGDSSSRRTIANGNLLIPRTTGFIPITLPQQEDTLDILLAELFRMAHVRFVIDPSTADSKYGVMCNNSPFHTELSALMFNDWDCSITDGVYSVFRRPTTGIVLGRPDLDTTLFVKEIHGYHALRPFYDEFFREANLHYVLSPGCPVQMPGLKFKGHFRELLKCALWDKLTFEVRDGVYYISPKPEGFL